MRNEKIQERLRMIEEVLTHGNIPVALAHLHSLSTALESEEVLAEGYIYHLRWRHIKDGQNQLTSAQFSELEPHIKPRRRVHLVAVREE